jgi:hypothetical protein
LCSQSYATSDIVKESQINQVKKYLAKEQSLFRGVSLQLDTVVGASYVASEMLAMKMKSFSDGEIKEYLSTDTAFPDQKKYVIYKISLSQFTIGRRMGTFKQH